jgi:hypothetical protein
LISAICYKQQRFAIAKGSFTEIVKPFIRKFRATQSPLELVGYFCRAAKGSVTKDLSNQQDLPEE